MARTLARGKEHFASLRQRHCFYVDKTKFLKEWWESESDVTLITRPRRFGKTLLLDTVKTFFSTEFAGQSHLFEGLLIWQDEAFRSLQGTIPVLSLSFADVKGKTYEDTIELIHARLIRLYKSFCKQLNMDALLETEKEQIASVRSGMSQATAQDALTCLCGYLVEQNFAKPIILLDEYDTPSMRPISTVLGINSPPIFGDSLRQRLRPIRIWDGR
ncbi:MAG: AAA family ATPase [Desulfovibrio sp.]|nr:AAA family ATPase [Desulfovibrio sp.]